RPIDAAVRRARRHRTGLRLRPRQAPRRPHDHDVRERRAGRRRRARHDRRSRRRAPHAHAAEGVGPRDTQGKARVDLGNLCPALILTLVIALALAPYVAVMVTAFTKLVVVFSLLRNALGLQQTPPNIVMNGLALILSVYVMYPVGLEMADAARPALT